MKLKELEEEILKVYNAYWNNYLEGNVEAMHPLLADEYTQVGSAESEVFSNKKVAVQFLYDTIDQVAGKLAMRNRKTTLEQQAHFTLIHEFCDLYALADGNWIFYSKFRASTFMQQKNGGWKIIHQHSSFPDAKAEYGQNVAIDIIAEENQQLHEAIKRRTVELEQKNRELEIETSLERVRAEAMGMNKPDDILAICKVMFTELKLLGFSQLRNTLINFWDDDSNTLIDYDYSDDTGGHKARLSYSSHPVFEQFQKKIKHSKDAFAELVVNKEELESWKKRRRDSGEYEDPRLNNISALYYYFYSIEVGAIGISTFSPITEEQLNVLKRFRNVFDFAYRRYADVAQAEAQAREAEIELALERVRARTMAMQRSGELVDVATVLFQQVKELGVPQWNCGFNIWNIGDKEFTYYPGSPDGIISPSPCKIPLTEHPVFKRFDESRRRGEELLVYEKEGEEQADHYRYMLSLPGVGDLLQSMLDAGFELPKFQIDHLANFAYGNLIFITYEHFPKMHDVFKRFAKVFEQTYTRFLDLQKVEAQVKESEIELALERVRARTMAMQKSSELIDVARELRVQLAALGTIELETCAINLYEESDSFIEAWTAIRPPDSKKDIVELNFKLPKKGIYIIEDMLEAYASGTDEFTFELAGEKGIQWMKTIETQLPDLFAAAAAAPGYSSTGFVQAWFSCCYFPGGALIMITMSPPLQESRVLLKRFTQVFGMAYRRFTDLKKAEAQAREAYIELGLERVRAKAMAMHASEDLSTVVEVVFEELDKLSIGIMRCGIGILNKHNRFVNVWLTSVSDEGNTVQVTGNESMDLHPLLQGAYDAWMRGQDFSYVLEGEDMIEYYKSSGTGKVRLPDSQLIQSINEINTQYYQLATFAAGGLFAFGAEAFTDEAKVVLKRFALVFNQSYTRFLDLQKAEAQAREAQIEAALERVRSRSMAMHKSDELLQVINVVSEQLQYLNFKFNTVSFAINNQSHDYKFWFAVMGNSTPIFIEVPYINNPMFERVKDVLAKGGSFYTDTLTPEENKQWHEHVFANADLSFLTQETKAYILRSGYARSVAITPGIMLIVSNYSAIAYTDGENEIIRRFAAVFDQSYTRFLDLQRAEAQAKEAQIDAALEKVRSRSLAMHKSEELQDVVHTVFEKLDELNVELYTAIIFLFTEGSKDIIWWLENKANQQYARMLVPYDDNQYLNDIFEAKEKGKNFFSKTYSFEEKNKLFHHLFENTDFKYVPENQKQFLLESDLATMSVALAKNTGINITSYTKKSFSEKENEILIRFGNVFEQAYTRFLDLQKAEAQAREAKIEAALEKVRARTMGMQKSDELADVAKVLFTELNGLVHNLWTCGFVLCEKERKEDEWWLSMDDGFTRGFFLPNVDDYAHSTLYEGWLKGEAFRAVQLKGKELQAHYDWLMKVPVAKSIFEEMDAAGLSRPDWQKLHAAYFSKGYLVIITREPCSEEAIFKRFAQVFDLTYTRFLDLQKAEAQAREAQIEAALERVRAKVMAMNNSKDLDDTSLIFGEQLRKLGIDWQFSYFWLIDEAKNENTFWITWPDYKTSITVYTLAEAEEYFNECLVSWRGGVKIHESHISTEEVQDWLNTFQRITDDAGGVAKQVMLPQTFVNGVYYYDAMMKYGSFGICINKPATNEEKNIQCRFAVEFERAYTRFLDLQKAETQARDAVKRASVDRIRAEIASMRTTSDLERIQPLIWNELNILAVPFIRCGVFIMDEENQEVNTLLSTPDGKAIAAFRQSYNVPGEISLIVDSWHKKKMYKQHWDEGQFLEFAKSLVQQGAVNTGEKYLTENRPTDLYLHFFPFLQGMLYVGNTSPLEDDELQLVQNLADAFSTAYARYEDFNKLELAKKQVDNTLNELQVTQKQLIQSEKMASLGELTAGIAHEIQNPLNFVNNFSEVSNELISEMVDEVEKGNTTEVKTIALNIQQNLEKIIHHGKRADAIVKGMLQHSRSGSGIKESIDINALADEYLRLAYHGLRAKDKSFNVSLKTDYDELLEKVNIIPQDIGRVILNLITNAFYAVNEKKKQYQSELVESYEPSVSVSTRKVNDKVEIKVADNGNGIPQKVLDKIFQPFFTTKPTGQGTGLGLSISYDIVKAHGGELIVNTTEGSGSEFILQLPIN